MSDTPRRARRARRSTGINQSPWRQVVNPYPPFPVLHPEQVEQIHAASLQILAELGIDFLLPDACERLRAAGCRVDGARVRMDPAFVMERIATVPAEFTLHARNPAHHLTFGGNHINFATVGSAPNASDLEGGRRPGNFTDYCNFLRLGQTLNSVHLMGGYPVEPVDLPPATRHLDCIRAFITLTDKAYHAYALGRARIVDALELTRLGRGISHEQLLAEPSLFTIVNSSSPLRIDTPMLEGLIEMAAHNQVVVLTPFTLAGAMAPATLAGALAQQNAEALAGIVLTQVVKPGAPAMYGGFTSNVDMRSGAPAFGTPEYAKAALAGGQLARRYHIPYRSSNANAATVVDAQAAYESMMSLWPAVLGHANLVLHGAGWLEGGLCASFEKMILDAELLQMMTEFLQPLVVNEDTLGLDALREVGPGGHFFGAAHTLARYETAFYAPLLSDWRNYESWREAGAPDATARAHRLYKELLADYEAPPLDPARREAIDDYVARRTAEGGVAT